MTKKRIAALVLVGLVFAVVLGATATVQAFPTRTSPCTGCHSLDTAVVVTATQTSNNGTTATYNVSVSDTYGDGVTGWGVFDGTTKVAGAYDAGSFSVSVAKTYTVFGVAGAGGQGVNSITISPVAPPPPPPPADTTPPAVSITSPADGATVSGSVAIAASASDASGIARVEFRVDGVLVISDTASPYSATWNSTGAAAGNHTIEAKAFDTAGNSAVSTVLVSIAAPPPPPPAEFSVVTVSVLNAAGAPVSGAKVILVNGVTGARYVVTTSATGAALFAAMPYGTYTIAVSARGYLRATSSVIVDTPTEAPSATVTPRRAKATALSSSYQVTSEYVRVREVGKVRISDDD